MRFIRKIFHFLFVKHRKKTGLTFILILLFYWFSLPKPLFDLPTSMVIEDASGYLLGARIASDGQWRFPARDSVPNRFAKALLTFEDRRFYQHPGIDIIGIGRAIQQNIKNKKIISGGSTLTMQTIRMARGKSSRSVFQKIIEVLLATRLELSYSKNEILALYSANAPFGGNVVGLSAASWRYYGKQPDQLSWSEAATLAVLPNSPGLIHPGRNRRALRAKRNRLLDRLVTDGQIDKWTCDLAKEEAIPEKPLPLPDLAPHLLERARLNETDNHGESGGLVTTTIDRNLQNQVNTILKRHQQQLSGNGIHNLAALVLEVETGKVIAYVGNVNGIASQHHPYVDVICAPRSTGSILKPFLYAMALDDGQLTPRSLLADIPLYLNGYRPVNYHESYDGMVRAERVLARSLNVPMVRLLQDVGLEKFHHGLQELGLTTINQVPSYYGLTLILGGAEASLWDITNAYAGMARTLNHFHKNNGQYQLDEFDPAYYQVSDDVTAATPELTNQYPALSAAACWQTFAAMRTVERPNSEGEWERFGTGQQIAWKTGTSFGFRDAWAVGVTPKYVVGVWAGNADGEGRPGLVGVKAAGPVLFDIFGVLKNSGWFRPPYDEMEAWPICAASGFRPTTNCPVDSVWIGPGRNKLATCRFHQLVHLDPTEKFRVNSSCLSPSEMIAKSWFVLPPVEAYYYRKKHPAYRVLPPFRSDCQDQISEREQAIQLIYPQVNAKIYVPIDLDGEKGRTVFRATHQQSQQTIYWHLDQEYLGATRDFHEMALVPEAGMHELVLVDEKGNRVGRRFEILKR